MTETLCVRAAWPWSYLAGWLKLHAQSRATRARSPPLATPDKAKPSIAQRFAVRLLSTHQVLTSARTTLIALDLLSCTSTHSVVRAPARGGSTQRTRAAHSQAAGKIIRQ